MSSRRSRVTSFATSMSFALSLAACGAGNTTEPATPTETADIAPPTGTTTSGTSSDASALPSAASRTEPLPDSCDGWTAAYACWRIGKAGGPDAARAAAGLREVCLRRETIEACAPALDLLGASLTPQEAKTAAKAGCNAYAQVKEAVPLQAAACTKVANDMVASGKHFLSLDAYDKGCSLGSQAACDAVKKVHADLAAEGRDVDPVQFPMGGMRDSAGGYRLNDVGCHLEKSTDFKSYFSELGAPFFAKKKALVACIGADGSAPVYWHGHGGKIVEVRAKTAPCVEKILLGTPYKLDVACGAVLMAGAKARAEDDAHD